MQYLKLPVVTKAPQGSDEAMIAAYLVSDRTIDFDAVRAVLSKKLPEYMIPTYMTQIEQLPVTLTVN